IAIDGRSGTVNGKSNMIYISAWGSQVYKSGDGGASWTPTSQGPSSSLHMIVSRDGTVWAVSQTADFRNGKSNLWNYSHGKWTQVTAAALNTRSALQTVAADPANARHVVVADAGGVSNVSRDEGATWSSPMYHAYGPDYGKRVADDVPWLAWTNESYMSTS